jgi:hypothetical protein
VDRHTTEIPKRPALPLITIAFHGNSTPGRSSGEDISHPSSAQLADSLRLAMELKFPIEKYKVEVSTSEQSSHMNQFQHWATSGVRGWSAVYVVQKESPDSAKLEKKGTQGGPLLFGMISQCGIWKLDHKSSESIAEMELIILPCNFHKLFPLIKQGVDFINNMSDPLVRLAVQEGRGLVQFPQLWYQDMMSYMSSIPAYLYSNLSSVLRTYNMQNVVPKDIPIYASVVKRQIQNLTESCVHDVQCFDVAQFDNLHMQHLSEMRSEHLKPDDGQARNSIAEIKYRKTILPNAEVSKILANLSSRNKTKVSSLQLQMCPTISMISPYFKPMYNGAPVFDPWPPSVLGVFDKEELCMKWNSSEKLEDSIAFVRPTTSIDLITVWDRMRRNLYGGGESSLLRQVGSTTGVSSGLNSSKFSRKELRKHSNDAYVEKDWIWFKSCGATSYPRMQVSNYLIYIMQS